MFSFLENFTIQNIPGVLTGLACYLTGVVMIFIVAWVVYSGIRYFLTTREGPYSTMFAILDEHKNFKYTLIGMAIIFSVYTIIASIAGFLGYTDFKFASLSCSSSFIPTSTTTPTPTSIVIITPTPFSTINPTGMPSSTLTPAPTPGPGGLPVEVTPTPTPAPGKHLACVHSTCSLVLGPGRDDCPKEGNSCSTSSQIKSIMLTDSVGSPVVSNLIKGQINQLRALAVYTDGGQIILATNKLNWSSSNPTLITVDQNGLIKVVGSSGTAQITGIYTTCASSCQTFTGLITITVGSTTECTLVHGTGPIKIVFQTKNNQIDGLGHTCTQAWTPAEMTTVWSSSVTSFGQVLDNYPPFTTTQFSMWRSNIMDSNACGNANAYVLITRCDKYQFIGWAQIGGRYTANAYNVMSGDSILAHELGHIFGTLADEYVTASGIPFANLDNTNCKKGGCPGNLSTCYEGCNYVSSGWFRDAENDVMNNGAWLPNTQFGPVDQQRISDFLQKAIP